MHWNLLGGCNWISLGFCNAFGSKDEIALRYGWADAYMGKYPNQAAAWAAFQGILSHAPLFVCLSACLSLSLSLYLYLHLYLYLCICLYLCVSVCICVYLCVSMCICVYLCVSLCLCLSASLPLCLPLSLSVCLPVCLPACLSVCLSVCLSHSFPTPGSHLDLKLHPCTM